MDLNAIASEIENEPPRDTSDGSASWFRMNHEEAVLLRADGAILHRTGSSSNADTIHYPKEAFATARNGGLIMHSHPVWCAASFSLADLWTCFSNPHEAGMVMVVTTAHLVNGWPQSVRYIIDSRTVGTLMEEAVAHLAETWDREERVAFATLSSMVVEATDEEMLSIHQHMVVERICRQYGVEYRREVA
jgi:hypothetical protein